ncbi:MAG TPA: DUF3047 domain-containing protein [Myxococcaceae bacterium]|nr:DUF3047 domain-containing protein [Myxococcaceae bacterium]
MLDILLGLTLAGSSSAGTALDIHSFQVVKQSSGPVDYYTVETGPDGTYLAARYRPPLDTVVRGIEIPEGLRRTVSGIQWRWRVHAFPKGADDCNPKVGDAAGGVHVTFKAGQKVMIIKYVWNSTGPADRSCELVDTLFFAKRDVVLRAGGSTGTWQTETVDPRADFVRLFGGKLESVPDFVGLGVLTDGDATHSVSEADYADFVLLETRRGNDAGRFWPGRRRARDAPMRPGPRGATPGTDPGHCSPDTGS